MMVVAAEPQAPEAVGGAGRARDKVLAAVVLVGVGAHDEDLGVLLGVGLGDNLLGAAVEDGLGGLLGEEDAGGLADAVGAPPDLLGVAAADGVALVLIGHAVGGGRPALMALSLTSSSSIMTWETSRPIRQRPLRAMPVVMAMEAVVEVALRAVPANEKGEAEPTMERAKAT